MDGLFVIMEVENENIALIHTSKSKEISIDPVYCTVWDTLDSQGKEANKLIAQY